MSTLTRRDRVAVGAVQGGALYYSDKRRWPEPAPGIFEKFGSPHPGGLTRPPTDVQGHQIGGFIVSDIDGTPKLYSGYGGAIRNIAPIHIWPLNLNGIWDPVPAHTMQCFGIHEYHVAEGKLWCYTEQGPKSFCTGSPGGTWVDGECFPHPGNDGGMTHGHHIARHDGYTWIAGQRTIYGNSGTVWRGTTPTGSDGEYVWGSPMTLGLYTPNDLFSYQGKLWMQPNSQSFDPEMPIWEDGLLCYWDESAHTFLPTDLRLSQSSHATPWKNLMLVLGSYATATPGVFSHRVETFNGTTLTTVYESFLANSTVVNICVTADDTVWILDSTGVFRSSTDLVTWTERMQLPSTIDRTVTGFLSFSFTVYGDFVYTGDAHDQIWRAKVTP